MSTFAVFGMTAPRALQLARDDEWRKAKKEGEHVDSGELERRAKESAARMLEGVKVVQLSEFFDSPGPAEQFADLARRLHGGARLSIRVREKIKAPELRSGYRYSWAVWQG